MKIPYGRQEITPEDVDSVVAVLKAEFLTQGPSVASFEKKISEFLGANDAVVVSNGTAALHLAVAALGLKPGEKVLTTPNTFVASANCVRYCEGEVEFVDIDPETFCMDLDKLEQKLSHSSVKYAGIVVVSFAGYPVDGERLRALANRYGVWIIEDACHALGAERWSSSRNSFVKAGNSQFADVSVFSFHPVKHITSGEGGAVTASSPEVLERVRLLRSHGIVRDAKVMRGNDGPWYYEMQELGFNYRLPDILCALGQSQLSRIEANLQSRREIADRYDRELKGVLCPKVDDQVKHAFHLYVVRTPQRDQLYTYLRENGVYCQIHYIPVHKHPYYIDRYGKQSLPVAEAYYQQAMSIPMFHSMTQEEQSYVISKINSFFQ